MPTPEAPRPRLPPFDPETAAQKVRMAEVAWNTRDPVRFAYEWRDDSGNWYAESERKYRWPLGRRPDDHPGLSDLGL